MSQVFVRFKTRPLTDASQQTNDAIIDDTLLDQQNPEGGLAGDDVSYGANSSTPAANEAGTSGPNATAHLIFNISYISGQTLPTGMQAALNYVNTYLSSIIKTNVTVNVQVGYQTYDHGQAVNQGGGVEWDNNASNNTTNSIVYSYATVRAALIAHATTAAQIAAVNSLPVSEPAAFGGKNIFLQAPEARALGLAAGIGNAEGFDAYIGFGAAPSGTSYSFDPTNRAVSSSVADFIGIALHEFTHALDRVSNAGFSTLTVLDLFKYSAAGTRGGLTSSGGGYFSIDGGVTNLENYATSSDLGDFLNTPLGGGAYIPESSNAIYQRGYLNGFTPVDRTLMSVLGYNMAPMPDATRGEYNGDGRADIFWRNKNGAAIIYDSTGSGSFTGQNLGIVDQSWQVAAQRDFNSDGLADILWRNTNGATLIWDSNGSGGFTGVNLGIVDTSWQIAGTADFNGDGTGDILWRNTNGAAIIYESDLANGYTGLNLGIIDPSWKVAGVGDFNKDGQADILWRNTNGAALIWDSNSQASHFTGLNLGIVDASWSVAAVSDFNNDGSADILWRNANGAALIWDSNGSGGFTGVNLGIVDPSWSVAQVSDFNNDGSADILWRNTNGAALIWNSNGSGSFTGLSLGIVDPTWFVATV